MPQTLEAKVFQFELVDQVTTAHAKAFAAAFVKKARESGTMSDALTAGGIMKWPDEDACGCSPDGAGPCVHQSVYLDSQDEIEMLVLRRLGPALRDVFRQSAEEVLSRLRREGGDRVQEEIHARAKESA